MRILLVDDHALFVEGLQNLLKAGGYDVVGTAYNGREAVLMARQLRPDVILMDIRMPIYNGVEATRMIKTEQPDTKIVILSTSSENEDLFNALRSGASGYLLKNLKPKVLLSYLEGLARGEAPLSRELSACLLQEFSQQSVELNQSKRMLDQALPQNGNNGEGYPPDELPAVQLTSRQREILELVASGLSYKEVGAELHISENTVKYHMGEIVRCLHLKNRSQVVAYALSTGLVRCREFSPTDEIEA